MRRALPAKAKISVTIAAELVSTIDRGVRARHYPSRSAVVEAALDRWARVERRRQRDAEIEAYYLGMSAEERADERQWADFATRELAEIGAMEARRERAAAPAGKRRRS
ncbi:MAG: ribbon-helix-helix protein, CopG family [Deltaproteobacteria bacterium]|nr:ribbon-helix-helix protein, CopG family [Deltaproteobacteria bacterium]